MNKPKKLNEYEAYLLYQLELFNDKLDKLLEDEDMKNLNDNIKCIDDLTSGELGLDEQGEK